MYKTLFIEKYTQYKREATICKVQRRDNDYLSSMKGGLTLIILEIIVIAVLTVAFVKATLCGRYPVSRTSKATHGLHQCLSGLFHISTSI